MFNNYPTDADLVAFLTSMGLWVSSLSSAVSGYMEATINRFEQLTGRLPFLAESTSSVTYFDPPGAYSRDANYSYKGGAKILELDNGYTEITAITIGITTDNPSGTVMDLTRSLRFLPLNRSPKEVPIEAIEFFYPVWGPPGSIKITGKRGYSSTIPADVYRALLLEGAASFSPILGTYNTAGASEIAEADVRVKFGGSSSNGMYSGYLGDQANAWHMQFMNTVNRYTVIRLGVN